MTVQMSTVEARRGLCGDGFNIFRQSNAPVRAAAPHSHDFYELCLPLEGRMTLEAQGRRLQLEPGGLLLIGPGTPHRPEGTEDRPFERITLWLGADFASAAAQTLPRARRVLAGLPGRCAWLVPDGQVHGRLRSLMETLIGEKRDPDEDSPALGRWIIQQLLVYLGRCAEVKAAPHSRESRDDDIRRVYAYIVAHLTGNLSVSGLADQFHMDRNTMTRQFKRVVGTTPGECIRRRRLEVAHAMIEGGAGMQEACSQCGFSDYSAFYRAFRHAYGVSPSAFGAAAHDANDTPDLNPAQPV